MAQPYHTYHLSNRRSDRRTADRAWIEGIVADLFGFYARAGNAKRIKLAIRQPEISGAGKQTDWHISCRFHCRTE